MIARNNQRPSVPGTRKREGAKYLPVATWNVRTLNGEGDLELLLAEMRRARVRVLGVAETPCATFRLHGARGGTPGGGGRTYCPPPQSRQRKRRPTAEESGSRRKARHSRRPPSERWGKGVAALDPTLNQAKAGALRGPACGALRWGWSGAWGGIGERQRGVLVADSLVGIQIPTLGLQEGGLGAGGRVKEGEMRLGGKGGGGGAGGGSIWGWGRGWDFWG